MNLIPMPRTVGLTGPAVRLHPAERRIDPSLPAQGYVLRIEPSGVTLVGADQAGLFYGETTLAQLARLARAGDGTVPAGVIEDHPDLPVRAVMLDISRDKVPTVATLEALIDRLAALKVNMVQLYSEHTFAYRDHPEVHAAASALQADDIHRLDEFCRSRHVELVPNQNCLGHMNRWLAHERYRSLALEPDGFVDPFGIARAPMTIDPANPASLELVRSLLAELLPNFTSRRVHVGLDEPWELPAARVQEFLAWVRTFRALPELDGYEMLMWGDVVAGVPDLAAALPGDVTVCEWGYESWAPFDEHCAVLAGAGIPFWVAPGTSSWTTILGRITNARGTCANAAAAALAHGGTGFLNTDWGDNGHLQQSVISEPALAYGAAVSWCLEANGEIDLAAALSAHVFEDPTGRLARALLSLGDVHLLVDQQIPNMSSLVLHLYYPQLGVAGMLRDKELVAVEECLDEARADVAAARPARADGAWLLDEVRFSIDLVSLMVADARARLRGDGHLGSVDASERARLGETLDSLVERYRELWLRRNGPGGLEDSLAWLRNLRAAYGTGRPDPTWGGLKAREVRATPG